MGTRNLAGRAGKWSAENWKKALFGWLVFAVAAMVLGNLAGHIQMPDSKAAAGESARALQMLEQAGFKQPATESVLIHSRESTIEDSPMISALAGVIVNLNGLKDVTNIQDPRLTQSGQISRDGHSTHPVHDQGRSRLRAGQAPLTRL